MPWWLKESSFDILLQSKPMKLLEEDRDDRKKISISLYLTVLINSRPTLGQTSFLGFLIAQEQFDKYQKNRRKYQWAEYFNVTSWTQQTPPLFHKLCDKIAFSYSYLLTPVAQTVPVVLSLSHSACLTSVFIGILTENVYRGIKVMDLDSNASRNTDLIVPQSSPYACSPPL